MLNSKNCLTILNCTNIFYQFLCLQILEDVLKKKMELLDPSKPWETGATDPPPWDWKKLWHNYSKHWVNFQDDFVTYEMRNCPDELKNIILKHEEGKRNKT